MQIQVDCFRKIKTSSKKDRPPGKAIRLAEGRWREQDQRDQAAVLTAAKLKKGPQTRK